jgi:hypothetical protein
MFAPYGRARLAEALTRQSNHAALATVREALEEQKRTGQRRSIRENSFDKALQNDRFSAPRKAADVRKFGCTGDLLRRIHKGGTVDRDAPNVSAYFIGISQRQVFDDLDIALVGWRRLEREQALEGTE